MFSIDNGSSLINNHTARQRLLGVLIAVVSIYVSSSFTIQPYGIKFEFSFSILFPGSPFVSCRDKNSLE